MECYKHALAAFLLRGRAWIAAIVFFWRGRRFHLRRMRIMRRDLAADQNAGHRARRSGDHGSDRGTQGSVSDFVFGVSRFHKASKLGSPRTAL